MKISVLSLFGLLIGTSSMAQAQPADPAKPPVNFEVKPQTPAEKEEAQNKIIEDAVRQGQEQARALLKMSPEERNVALQKLMERAFRMQLTASGFTDEKLQDTLVNFVALQEKERGTVRQAGSKVWKAMQEKDGIPEQTMSLLLSDYLGAVEEAKSEREKDCKALDDAIGYSTKPRLMALLNILGLVGDASFYSSNLNMIGNMSVGGLVEPLAAIPVAKQ